MSSPIEQGQLLAACCAAWFAVLVVRSIVPPRRALASRIEPYAAYGRSRLGTGAGSNSLRRLVIADDSSALKGVFGPSLVRAAERLSRLVDAADNDELELRLRQAGIEEPDLGSHRMRQLAAAVGGCFVGLTLGVTLFGSGIGTLAMFGCFTVAGLSMQRGAVDRAIGERNERLRAEVPVIAQLLAVHLRTGHGPVEAVRNVSKRSSGPVAADCREALGLIAGGLTPQAAYERLATTTAEPAAARLYRLLASSARRGGDIAVSLLSVANEVRAEQREALARRSVKRRTAMVIPLLLLVAPVMVLFVAAALPSLVFGQL